MGRKCIFSEEERIKIAVEYVHGKSNLTEINRKYGIVSKNMLYRWIKLYHIDKSYPKKSVSLQPEPTTDDSMKAKSEAKITPEDPSELLARIAQLEKELKWEKMRTHALETLIDVAEENGLKVRKKSGAKQ